MSAQPDDRPETAPTAEPASPKRASSDAPDPEQFFDPRQRRACDEMLRAIAEEVVGTEAWLGKAALAPAVLRAMAAVPRHRFVPERHRAQAYDNRPLPIGDGQTISQPYIVAVMTDLAAIAPDDKVLEIGTGCGYQAAVLARLAGQVFSIETLPALAAEARERLQRLGYGNIALRCGDGSLGWPEEAPFDAIIVTAAAARRVPPPLIAQLAPGGRLVIPVQHGGRLVDGPRSWVRPGTRAGVAVFAQGCDRPGQRAERAAGGLRAPGRRPRGGSRLTPT